jgi:hypothetical protein
MRPLAVLFSRDSAPLQAANDRVVANVRGAFMVGMSPVGETIPHPRSQPEVLHTVVGVVDDPGDDLHWRRRAVRCRGDAGGTTPCAPRDRVDPLVAFS